MSTTFKSVGRPRVRSIRQIEVLVVQSNPADTLLTIEALKAAGLKDGLRCVSEGKDALGYMLRKGPYANVPIPDLIFLDLSQPRMASLEVLKFVRSTPALTHIPIVVAAGSDDPQFVQSVYALNGNCFIRKPDELEEFARFIDTCYKFWCGVVTLVPSHLKTAPEMAGGGRSIQKFSKSLDAPTAIRRLN
jgi:two-component system, chemotaxis family, response regulator Rcp1